MRWITLLLLVIISSASAQIDWNYINNSNEMALAEFLDDHMTAQKFQSPQDRGCCQSWKGTYNCTNYGIAMWVLEQARRCTSPTLKARAYRWLALHANHVMNYGYN